MKWLNASAARAALGLSKSVFDGRVRRGLITKRQGERAMEYLVTPDASDPQAAPGATKRPEEAQAPPPTPEALTHRPGAGEPVQREGYVYFGDRDLYLVICPSQGKRAQQPVPGETVRALWASYTSGATEAEVCREFGLERRLWKDLRRSLGLTHTRAPWTDEEIDATPEAELLEDVTRKKERRILLEAQRREWARIQASARKWDSYRVAVLDHLASREITPVHLPTPAPVAGASSDWILTSADWHIGKAPADPRGWTLDRQVDGLGALCVESSERALRLWGQPGRIWLSTGGDLLHADTHGLTTTAGTPQGAQAVGTLAQHLDAAVDLLAAWAERLATIAPVTIIHTPGNHDRSASYGVAVALRERYRRTDAVEVVATGAPHTFVRAASCVPVMMTHGDGMKRREYQAHLHRAVWTLPELRGSNPLWGLAVEGHWHSARAEREEVGGVRVITVASPGCDDSWHVWRGYTLAQKGATLIRVDSDGGTGVEWVGR